MRITSHFNELTEAEQERLVILMEECNEVAQIACKILRHGYTSYNPMDEIRKTNRQLLEVEVGHVCHAITKMVGSLDVDPLAILNSETIKKESIKKYLHHNA